MTNPIHAPDILIVDDEPINLRILGEILSTDYQVRVATSGSDALEIAMNQRRPDLVLLDIMMPGMDGYTVCRELKMEPATRNIPVIFITAKSEVADEEKGFRFGAVDYVTKPFNPAIVKARVQTHLELKAHQDQLEKRVAERTRELIQTSDALKSSMDTIQQARDRIILTEKMADLGSMVAAATHDINTPLGVSATALSLLQEEMETIHRSFEDGSLTRSEFQRFVNRAVESIRILDTNVRQAAELIQSFKTVAVDQCSDNRRPIHLDAYIREIITSLSPKLRKTDHEIQVDCPGDIRLNTYPGAIAQILTNLIMNSLIHGFQEGRHNVIAIQVETAGPDVDIHYRDNGKGIPEDLIEKVFDPFFTTKRDSGGSGLGLHIVYDLAVRRLEGALSCESRPGEGVHFRITLPMG